MTGILKHGRICNPAFSLVVCALLLVCFFNPCSISAQESEASQQIFEEKLTSQELESLLAPIALYPDELLAQVLPASTVPLDVVKAARYQETHNNTNQPPAEGMESWDPAVISLMNYPDVLKMMYDDLEWTETLGQAVYAQENDVYDAIQQLRIKADAAESLVTNEKQVIVHEKEIIRIVPANPEIIYVPYYDPYVVYAAPHPTAVVIHHPPPLVTFGVGIAVGLGLSYAFDWHHRHIVHHRHWYNHGHHRYHHHYYKKNVNININANRPGRPGGKWRPHKPIHRVGKPRKGPGGRPGINPPGRPRKPIYRVDKSRKRPGGKPGIKQPERPPSRYRSDIGKIGGSKSSRRPPKTAVQKIREKPVKQSRPSAIGNYNRRSDAYKQANRGKQSRQYNRTKSKSKPKVDAPRNTSRKKTRNMGISGNYQERNNAVRSSNRGQSSRGSQAGSRSKNRQRR